MIFERGYLLFLLLVLPYIWYYLVYKKENLRIKFSNFVPIKNVVKTQKSLNLKKLFSTITTVILALLIIASAGPKKGIIAREETKHVVDIMLCLDTSTSMLALDFMPKNRFEVARSAAKEFVKLRKHDRLGLVIFSGVPILQCPLTIDKNAVLKMLDNSQIGMIKVDGTAIGSAIMACISRMKDAPSKSKIIVLLTDGINNMGEIDPITAAKAAQSMDIKIYTIGCGTAGGKSLYIIDDPLWGKRQVYLPQDLDEPMMIQIADITGGKYFNVKTKERMYEVFKEIDKLEKTEVKMKEYKEYKYLHQAFLVLAFLLFIVRFVLEKLIFLKIP